MLKPKVNRTPSIALFLVAVCAGSCGGSDSGSAPSPTQAATPAPRALKAGTAVTIVSGEDHSPVAKARVVLAGQEYVADGAGQVVLTADVPYGGFVDVVAEGFLSRQTVVPSDGTSTFALWPRESTTGLDEGFTTEIVYTAGWSVHPQYGSSPLERLREGDKQVSIVISETINRDEVARDIHEAAVREMNFWLEGRIAYVLTTTRPSTGIIFDVSVDRAREPCGGSALAFFSALANSRGEIVGGEIVYCRRAIARDTTVLHEFGHTVGLQHSYGENFELMGPYYTGAENGIFSDREGLAMRLLFERPAGNRFPDTDRSVTASAAGVRTTVCF